MCNQSHSDVGLAKEVAKDWEHLLFCNVILLEAWHRQKSFKLLGFVVREMR
jgi:hypothetical protein